MHGVAWTPRAVPREEPRGKCNRRCCWRGPNGKCQPVDPKACQCHPQTTRATGLTLSPLGVALFAILDNPPLNTQEHTA